MIKIFESQASAMAAPSCTCTCCCDGQSSDYQAGYVDGYLYSDAYKLQPKGL